MRMTQPLRVPLRRGFARQAARHPIRSGCTAQARSWPDRVSHGVLAPVPAALAVAQEPLASCAPRRRGAQEDRMDQILTLLRLAVRALHVSAKEVDDVS